MEYQIRTIDEMIVISTDGKTREDCLRRLEEHLDTIELHAQKFFFIEVYSGGKVAGAMALAQLDEEPEHSKKFKKRVLKEAPYLLIDIEYEELMSFSLSSSNNQIDFNNYLKEQGYKIIDLPFFEFREDLGPGMIRLYIMLKKK